MNNIQLDDNGRLRHLLTLDGLPREIITEILDTAESFSEMSQQGLKKLPLLRGKTICNLFFEGSTRTRTTFELAEKRLSADVVSPNISTSAAATKGETLRDTLRNLEAMQVDMFVVRHRDSGAAHYIAQNVAPGISVINAGDGRHAHPTQALLDMFTIRRHKKDFEQLRVAIVGDVLHSRVARSEIHALNSLGTGEVRVVGPKTLLPQQHDALKVHVYHDLKSGLRDVDVIIMLRLQRERMEGALLPSEHEYFQLFGLTTDRLRWAKPDVMVMHPGPINRGVEMDTEVADGPHSVILEQVTHGLSVRMAVMSMALGASPGNNTGDKETRP